MPSSTCCCSFIQVHTTANFRTNSSDIGSRAITDDAYALVGGRKQLKIPLGVYDGMLHKAKRDRDPPKKLALLMVTSGYLFTTDELSPSNATGKTTADVGRGRVADPKLDNEKLSALCYQVKLEFPYSSIRAGDSPCERMQALIIIS